jgi:hypothetical protein
LDEAAPGYAYCLARGAVGSHIAFDVYRHAQPQIRICTIFIIIQRYTRRAVVETHAIQNDTAETCDRPTGHCASAAAAAAAAAAGDDSAAAATTTGD